MNRMKRKSTKQLWSAWYVPQRVWSCWRRSSASPGGAFCNIAFAVALIAGSFGSSARAEGLNNAFLNSAEITAVRLEEAGATLNNGTVAACCLPNGTCMDFLIKDCVAQSGTPGPDGSSCLIDNNGNGQPDACEYMNWVIADDFCLKCPNCTCDLDQNGICDNADLNFLMACAVPGAPNACVRADLACDGIADDTDDVAAWQCLSSGLPPAQCCNQLAGGIKRGFDRLHWWGSYFDSDFEPPSNTRNIDTWLVGIHRDIPPVACPAVAPGFKPVDKCGTLSVDAGGCSIFTPNGGGFSYAVVGSTAPYVPGNQFRICGVLDPSCGVICTTSYASCLVVNAVMECDTAVSRPGDLVMQWGISDSLVQYTDKAKNGCDGHRVHGYSALLINGCIAHNFAGADEWNAGTGTFHPRPNNVYWLSIQASVGHGFTAPPGCTEFATNNPATGDIWGWHTTPPGFHNKDDAYVGMVSMGCFGEWIYTWSHHLHWSDKRYRQCADDPTKSMDMAFNLLGMQGNPPYTMWSQPSNPSIIVPPPFDPDPLDRTIPAGDVDELVETNAELVIIEFFGIGTFQLNNLRGPTLIARSNPLSDLFPGTGQTIETEILAMNLVGTSPIGPVQIRESPTLHSVGTTHKPSQAVPPASMDSFFDIHIEIDLPSAPAPFPQRMRTMGPVRVTSPIHEVPPSVAAYDGPPVSVQLQDRDTLAIVGRLIRVIHVINYRGGINVHSDADWPAMPMPVCCPDVTGLDCVPTTCPVVTEICRPNQLRCIGNVCTVNICDCVDGDDCHIEYNAAVGPFCVNNFCPPGMDCRLVRVPHPTDPGVDLVDCRCINDPPVTCCVVGVIPPYCINTTVSGCNTLGGIPQAAPANCVNAPEACCLPSGACYDIVPFCCDDLGGTSLGTGSACANADTNGNGVDDACDIACEPLPSGLACTNTTCPTLPEVCFPTKVTCGAAGCIVTECDCIADDKCRVEFQPGALPHCVFNCPVAGQVCVQRDVTVAGGIETTCVCEDPPVTCCVVGVIPPYCINTTVAGCNALGGIPQAAPANCVNAPEACCLPSGACYDIAPFCCDDLGGTSLGTGSACANADTNGNGVDDACDIACEPLPSGLACTNTTCPTLPEVCFPTKVTCGAAGCIVTECDCIADDKCRVEFQPGALPFCVFNCPAGQVCVQKDVTVPAGIETTCVCEDPQVACCVVGVIPPYCINTTVAGCNALGGIPQPAPSSCTGATEACCLPSGACADIIPLCCDDLGGTSLGAGSACANADADGDGIDDACETGCAPDASGTHCVGNCPTPGDVCHPTAVTCNTTGCLITACGCDSGNVCHIDMVLGAVPFCVQGCPVAGQICQRFDIPVAPSGTLSRCDCAPPAPEACCLNTATGPACSMLLAANCVAQGGTPQGAGSVCTTPTACCTPDGRCTQVDPICCDELGGISYPPGTPCHIHADIAPKPNGSGLVDVDDLIKVLEGFSDYANAPNADIYPCTGPNGMIDVDDLIMVLDAFSGLHACSDSPCPL